MTVPYVIDCATTNQIDGFLPATKRINEGLQSFDCFT